MCEDARGSTSSAERLEGILARGGLRAPTGREASAGTLQRSPSRWTTVACSPSLGSGRGREPDAVLGLGGRRRIAAVAVPEDQHPWLRRSRSRTASIARRNRSWFVQVQRVHSRVVSDARARCIKGTTVQLDVPCPHRGPRPRHIQDRPRAGARGSAGLPGDGVGGGADRLGVAEVALGHGLVRRRGGSRRRARRRAARRWGC